MVSQPKPAVHQQPAKLFQQHWRHLKGNYDLNSRFQNADKSVPAVSFTTLRHYHYKANMCWHLPEEIFINQLPYK
jgi:hypothetical protein